MENFFELVEELEKYKKGYEAMMEYFDSIPEDEKPKLDLKLKTLGL
jgi:hypothetical protein